MIKSLFDNFEYEVNTGTYGSVKIDKINDTYVVFVNNVKWMIFNSKTKQEAHELKLHYNLANGHVIATGLGLGIREQLLLSKDDVKSLTVLEKSSDLINFHKTYSKWTSNPKLDIINISAEKYKGTCDVLLLDHYEQQNFIAILNNVINISNNIRCNAMWFWPFEDYILRNSKDYNYTLLESYNDLKNKYSFNKFPNLIESELAEYCEPFANVRE